jgi:hypothetical protein
MFCRGSRERFGMTLLNPRYTVPPKLVDLIRSRGCEIGVHDLNHEGGLYGQLGLG